MTALTDFLLARIDEDWRMAVVEATLRNDDPYWGSGESSKWERRITPERLLDECESRRHIVVNAMQPCQWVLRYLAAPYANHPDYRQEWKP